LAVLISGIQSFYAQNTGEINRYDPIIIDDPIQINEDLIGRCTIENLGNVKSKFYVKYGEQTWHSTGNIQIIL
jgi:hypothetical protein